VVVLAPKIFVTVPNAAFPPTIPFTSQMTFVFRLPVTCAVNCCVADRATLAVAGLTVTLTGGRIVTFMMEARVGSAAGAAVSVMTPGEGASTGA